MSQVTHPRISLPTRVRANRAVWLAALLAIAAGAAIAVILALGNGSTEKAASVGGNSSLTYSGPDESRIAAAVSAAVGGNSSPTYNGPDESRIAAAVSAAVGGNSSPTYSGPDEIRIAESISGR